MTCSTLVTYVGLWGKRHKMDFGAMLGFIFGVTIGLMLACNEFMKIRAGV